MKQVEVSGKTVEEAVASALKQLGASSLDVTVEVLEAGSKGFFGFGSKPAKVKVTKKYDPVATAKTFLREVFTAMKLAVEIECTLKEKDMHIDLKGADIGILIGKRGQTLDSLQYIVNLVVNNGDAPYMSITLDTENYRQRRKETLESLAINLAKKVKITRTSVVLEPMTAYERRIIHSTLQSNRYINTYSEGTEPHRYVVIAPKYPDARPESKTADSHKPEAKDVNEHKERKNTSNYKHPKERKESKDFKQSKEYKDYQIYKENKEKEKENGGNSYVRDFRKKKNIDE